MNHLNIIITGLLTCIGSNLYTTQALTMPNAQIQPSPIAMPFMYTSSLPATALQPLLLPPLLHMMQKSFFNAVLNGDLTTVMAIHKAGFDINSVDNNGKTALSRFIQQTEWKSINDNHIKTIDYLSLPLFLFSISL